MLSAGYFKVFLNGGVWRMWQSEIRTIGQAVAMGLDNDCTAATAGSILGAILGKRALPPHWWKPFRNRARTYLIGHEWWRNTDIAHRFVKQAAVTLAAE